MPQDLRPLDCRLSCLVLRTGVPRHKTVSTDWVVHDTSLYSLLLYPSSVFPLTKICLTGLFQGFLPLWTLLYPSSFGIPGGLVSVGVVFRSLRVDRTDSVSFCPHRRQGPLYRHPLGSVRRHLYCYVLEFARGFCFVLLEKQVEDRGGGFRWRLGDGSTGPS